MSSPRQEDVAEVGDGEQLIRHLDPRFHWDWKEDRPNVGAFKSGEVSTDREGMRPVEVARSLRAADFGFARLAVSVPRNDLGLTVRKDPLIPDEPLLIEPEPSLEYNPGHALILDATRKGDAKRMRDAAVVLHPCQQSATAAPLDGVGDVEARDSERS